MVCSLKPSLTATSRFVRPSATKPTTSVSRLASKLIPLALTTLSGAALTRAPSMSWSWVLLAQTCPVWTALMHLQSDSKGSARQKTPLAPARKASTTRTAIRPLMAFDGSSLGSFRDHDDTMLCTPQKDKQSRYALIAFQPARGGHRGEGPGKGAPCL